MTEISYELKMLKELCAGKHGISLNESNHSFMESWYKDNDDITLTNTSLCDSSDDDTSCSSFDLEEYSTSSESYDHDLSRSSLNPNFRTRLIVDKNCTYNKRSSEPRRVSFGTVTIRRFSMPCTSNHSSLYQNASRPLRSETNNLAINEKSKNNIRSAETIRNSKHDTKTRNKIASKKKSTSDEYVTKAFGKLSPTIEECTVCKQDTHNLNEIVLSVYEYESIRPSKVQRSRRSSY